jgi:NTE family protein
MPTDPVELIETDDPGAPLEAGTALCLSGGGYRAMVFHVGVLWRLYEAGLLGSLKRISSVSGESITSALLGLNWGYAVCDAALRRHMQPAPAPPAGFPYPAAQV